MRCTANTPDADTLRGSNLSRACCGGGYVEPSRTGDLKTTRSEVVRTNLAIVRVDMKDIGLLLSFGKLARNSIEKLRISTVRSS